MLSAARALSLSVDSAPELPRLSELDDLYRLGVRPRQGEVIMVAGRAGAQKSGLALWLVSRMNLPTLYLSGDMSTYQASIRLACSLLGLTTDEVEERYAQGGRARAEVEAALRTLDITFKFGPISWRGIDDLLAAFVETRNEYPKIIVVDNLMDLEGAESDYSEQMSVMQSLSALSRATGATVLVMHHATDGPSGRNAIDPAMPPGRNDIKNKLGEKPELTLTVGLDPTTLDYRIACVKQRMGPSDPSAQKWAVLTAEPSTTRFHRHLAPTPGPVQEFRL